MAIVTVNLNNPLNVSCQLGDTAYYVNTGSDGGFTVNTNDIVEIGTIVEIIDRDSTPTLKVYSTIAGWEGELSGTQFVLFSKDNKANLSSPLGYYASVKMVNDSTTEAELHSLGMDTFISSK
tara:strand:+ start:33 stop:398 length:366 start_codon:yes stop_codon:yes gene_type:complete